MGYNTIAGNWWFKHELSPWDITMYQKEGINTMNAVDLASMMLVEGKEVSCLEDVIKENLYQLPASCWENVDKLYFDKIFGFRHPRILTAMREANGNRSRAQKGGEAKAAKSHPQPTNESEV